MIEKYIKILVIALGVLIILSFLGLIYGMFIKISSKSNKIELNEQNISLLLNENDIIQNFQVIDKEKILITIINQGNIIGLIYSVNDKKILQRIDK